MQNSANGTNAEIDWN